MASTKRKIDIRRLHIADAKSYRAMLVEGLILHPTSFTEDYNTELIRDQSEIDMTLKQNGVFGAWVGNDLVGIGAVLCTAEPKRRHVARVSGLYVKVELRRQGIGTRLIEEILRFAASGVQLVQVEIPTQCESVIRLFERLKFIRCGVVPGGLQVENRRFDLLTMIHRNQ
jgi:ribosomal protein S18 acetylase RimI-like enzyme